MIRIDNLNIQLPGFAIRDVNLQIRQGEFFALMGPTGSGKSLVLESIAGLAPAGSGNIFIHDRDVTHLAPEDRKVSIVYQDHSLFPHLTVLENVTYGQRYHGMDKQKGRAIAHELLDRLGMSRHANRKPMHLSGGEKQRVAIARALACQPDVVLLDEPLSSLDPQFRTGLRTTLQKLHHDLGITFLMVTHDFTDALTLADRAAVIRNGRLEQIGDVATIFRRPATPFAARFVGMTNIFPASYNAETCTFCGQNIQLDSPPEWTTGHAALRPEDICILAENDDHSSWCILKGRIEHLDQQGFSWMAQVRCGDETVTALVDQRHALTHDFHKQAEVCLGFTRKNLHHLPPTKPS